MKRTDIHCPLTVYFVLIIMRHSIWQHSTTREAKNYQTAVKTKDKIQILSECPEYSPVDAKLICTYSQSSMSMISCLASFEEIKNFYRGKSPTSSIYSLLDKSLKTQNEPNLSLVNLLPNDQWTVVIETVIVQVQINKASKHRNFELTQEKCQ